ncbi:poly-gamma-glutamate synthesis protein (capsule biosynthesis protein) [Micromonospora narathiwatensis]|uniref:Poly-gamma-glutamate synthesis protein (Capsule biosynthesis protein) n=2 Tax=Micromonospora narathiwatensis TaxID=299146 RepID=A0A1A8ZCA3_9ACTN|nr:poly-gamma-glutamate synthesis protein (capsule biosynthesis protein) [Micromonospora narathiwatensis]
MRLGVAVLLVLLAGACTEPARVAPRHSAAPRATSPDPGTGTGPKNQLTVVAAGDLLVHPLLTEQAAEDARAAGRAGHDFSRVLAAIRPRVSAADLAICHMETPLADPQGPFTGWPAFSVPPELADAAAWAGFDTCSTASNHSLDEGMAGITRTLDNLDRVGLRHAGTARSAEEAARTNLLDVGGVKVAQLSYALSFNDIPLPEGRPWAANLIDRDAIRTAAHRARAAGAEIVILSMHWGTEYQNAPNDDQLDLAEQLLASPDIDLIIGHHVHVVQPFEKIGRKWVAYGMGNLTARFDDGSPENTQDAVVPEFTFTRTESGGWEVTSVSVLPTWMEYRPAARVVDLVGAARDPAVPDAQRAHYAEIEKRINGYVGMRGAFEAGLRPLS